MVYRISEIETPLIVRMAGHKALDEAREPAPEPEGKTFYVVTALLTGFMAVLAVVAVSAAVIVFKGGF